jgi:hypothetical protein
MRYLCICLGLLAGLAVMLSVPTRAAEKTDPETISKLIGKLSSNRFVDREKAQKALDAIGLPALEALRKAAEESKDMETRRRAAELVSKLEKQEVTAKVLTPTRLRLSFHKTPLKEAIGQFRQKSGYDIILHDPENKLKDRKVTLDTGETTFWEAFDQFCVKAGLVEASAQDLGQPVPAPPGAFPGGTPPIILPAPGVRPIRIQRIQIQVQPGKPIRVPAQKKPAVEKKSDEAPARSTETKPGKGASVPRAARAQVAVAQAAQTQPARAKAQAGQAPARKGRPVPAVVQPLPAIQPVPFGRPVIFPQPGQIGGQPGQLILKDGKEKPVPTCYSGAVRIQALADTRRFGTAPDGQILVGLKVSPEPKIRWQTLVNLRVTKAVDDQGQTLTPMMDNVPGVGAPPAPFGGFGGARGIRMLPVGGPWAVNSYGGLHQYLSVRLKKGEKASKQLKELSGTITAQVLGEPEVHIHTDAILKSSGKAYKGKAGGQIKVNGVQVNNGRVTVRVELEQPANVVPAQTGGIRGFNGGTQIILPPQVLPVPAPPPAAPGKLGAFQVQVQGRIQIAAPGAQIAPAQIQIQVGGGGVAFVPGYFGNMNGLELQDEKGKAIPCISSGMVGRAGPGGFVAEHQMIFQVQKDQKPARLVFKGSKQFNVDIPFTLKNVPLQ